MSNLKDLKNQLTAKAQRLQELVDPKDANGQARNLTDAEIKERDTLVKDIQTLESDVERAKAAEQALLTANRHKATPIDAPVVSTTKTRITDFSVTRGVQLLSQGRLHGPEGGLEKEVHQEGERIARASGLPISGGGLLIPENLNAMNSDAAVAERATAASGVAAGNLIGTNQMALLNGYQPQTVLEELGATMHTGLVGINNFPVSDFNADAGFVGETDNSNTREPNIRRPQATAKAVRAKTLITWALAAQAGPSTDMLIGQNLAKATQNAINRVALNGGASNEPSGIIADSDVTTVAIGTNGGAITYDLLIDMFGKLEVNDAGHFGERATVLTPEVKSVLQKLKIDTGSGQFVWDPRVQSELLGYKALATSLMPSTLTKGTSSGVCHGMVHGSFDQMHVCNWAVNELIIDRASDDTGTYLKIISFWDIVLANPKAFAKIVDITIS